MRRRRRTAGIATSGSSTLSPNRRAQPRQRLGPSRAFRSGPSRPTSSPTVHSNGARLTRHNDDLVRWPDENATYRYTLTVEQDLQRAYEYACEQEISKALGNIYTALSKLDDE